jgi:hypothetical protein
MKTIYTTTVDTVSAHPPPSFMNGTELAVL